MAAREDLLLEFLCHLVACDSNFDWALNSFCSKKIPEGLDCNSFCFIFARFKDS